MSRFHIVTIATSAIVMLMIATVDHKSSYAQQEEVKPLKVIILDDGRITNAVIMKIHGEWSWRSDTPINKPLQEGETITVADHRLSIGFGPMDKKFSLYEYKKYVELTIPSGATLEYRPWEARK